MELGKLRELAEATHPMETPSDWHTARDLECIGVAPADAALMAAMDRQTVLKLIEVAEKALETVVSYEAGFREDCLWESVENLRTALQGLRGEK